MAENKTKQTAQSVNAFLQSLADEQKKKDSKKIIEIMERLTGEKPKMWGTSLIGFGSYDYKYESGHSGTIFPVGFSPRKPAIVVYLKGLMNLKKELEKLGKHKTGKGCLYIKKLEDIDLKVFETMVKKALE